MDTKIKHKWIQGYVGLYSIGTNGVVLSHSRLTSDGRAIRARYLTNSINTTGYPYVTLSKENKRNNHLTHRLLAAAFIDNPCNFPVVKHLDDNKLNHELSNLQWDTHEQNVVDAHAQHYILCSPVGVRVEVYNMREFARANKLGNTSMNDMILGKRVEHKGWTLWDGSTKHKT